VTVDLRHPLRAVESNILSDAVFAILFDFVQLMMKCVCVWVLIRGGERWGKGKGGGEAGGLKNFRILARSSKAFM